MRRAVLVALIMTVAAAASAQPLPPILDAGLLPTASAKTRAGYEEFLTGNLPRAFAITPDGQFGSAFGQKSIEAARSKSLENCASFGPSKCAIYAENLDVVWPGRPASLHPAPPGEMFAGSGHAFVPDERYLWHGPAAARGVFVWSHGKGATDERGRQTQPYVRRFNNAGFDIIRFDRERDHDDKNIAAGWLRDGLTRLRQSGYRMIIAGGQSRGAWNSLQMLDTPGLADVVIAVSPAAQGTDPTRVILHQGPELWQILHDANAPGTRVAFVQFQGDPFADDEARRAERFHDMLLPKIAAGLLLDRRRDFPATAAPIVPNSPTSSAIACCISQPMHTPRQAADMALGATRPRSHTPNARISPASSRNAAR